MQAWDRVLAVNLRAVFLLSRLAVPDMLAAGKERSSTFRRWLGSGDGPTPLPYCASKFALTGFTQALGAEVRPHGVRACLVYPGAMATQWGTWSAEERREERPTRSPADALPPETVAEFIAWIAAAPAHLVLDEAIVTPLREQGYP